MMKLTFLLLLFSLTALAQPFAMFVPSAERLEGENYKAAMDRSLFTSYKIRKYISDPNSPHLVAERFAEYQLPEMEKWSSYREIRDAFRYVRDTRFLDWEYEGEEFMRRMSWLYPDDGCFVRAELMVENLEELAEPLPKKIFVFGDLRVKTKNTSKGEVRWWYHVAPIVAYQNDHYIIDPALKTKKPLKLKDWLKLMNENINNLEIAVCDSRTMAPGDSCFEPIKYELDMVLDYQTRFLFWEWQRVLQLDRDPVKELGDRPPWIFYLFGFIPIEY